MIQAGLEKHAYVYIYIQEKTFPLIEVLKEHTSHPLFCNAVGDCLMKHADVLLLNSQAL
jgi:hypothetical protein